MTIGTEWMVDAEGCSASALRDMARLRGVCDAIVGELGLRVVGEPQWHQFPQPGGVTGLYLLTESHLACHTYPESGIATFNLHCCKPRPEWAWEARLKQLLGASRVAVRPFDRGSRAVSDSPSFEANLSQSTSSSEVPVR